MIIVLAAAELNIKIAVVNICLQPIQFDNDLAMIEIKNQKDTLRSIPLFSELSIDQLREVTSISKLQKIPKNKIIFLEGDLYKGFYILLKGGIKIFKTTLNGKESVVHILNTLNLFADIPLFDGSNYPVNAQSLKESIVIFIPKQEFLNLLARNPEISLKMLAGFAKRLKSLINQVEDLSTKEVKNRLAKYLIREINSSGTENLPQPFIRLNIPKSTIASYLGTITETLSRTFNKMQSDGIIKMNGKKIFIQNLNELKKLAK